MAPVRVLSEGALAVFRLLALTVILLLVNEPHWRITDAFLATPDFGNRVRCLPLTYGQKQPRVLLFSSSTANDTSTTIREATTTEQQERFDAFSVLFEADPNVDAPLPPAYTGCPFTGIVAGPESFYRQASAALKSPPAFSFLRSIPKKDLRSEQSTSPPMVEIGAGYAIRQVLAQEFKTLTSQAVAGISQMVCGTKSLRTVLDRDEHKTIRNLVGVPLSLPSIAKSVPRLESICKNRIEKELEQAKLKKKQNNNNNANDNNNDTDDDIVVISHEITQGVTIDVTREIILGLNLKTPQEIETFETNVASWLRGMYYKPGSAEMNATMEARVYLVQAIEQKIDELEKLGKSDGSTVGGLLYATLEDAELEAQKTTRGTVEHLLRNRTLSREEVVDNALLLILAGTETTAAVAANVIFMVGLHQPQQEIWQRIIREQQDIIAKHGEEITADILQHECRYLDAVLQETLRILPVTLVSRRGAAETILVDGDVHETNHRSSSSDPQQSSSSKTQWHNPTFQIPKGWGVGYNMYLAHELDTTMEGGHMDLMKGFRPERWLSPPQGDNGAPKYPKPTKDFIPFGYGPRQCPGRLLSLMEMKVFFTVLARTVPKFELVRNSEWDFNRPLDEQIEWHKISSMLTPKDRVPIRVLRNS